MKTHVFISVYDIDEVNKKYNLFSEQEEIWLLVHELFCPEL